MIDAVLVYPNPSKDSPVKGTALSIFYVGAAAEAGGFDVEYIDERFDGVAAIEKLLKNNSPLVVAVSSMTGHQLSGAIRIFKYVKKNYPKVITVLGGVHGSLLPHECIKEEYLDFVVVGEGEETFNHLLSEIKGSKDYKNVKGLCWKDNGKIILNPDREFMKSDTWPFPMTTKNKRYFKESADAGELFFLSSRGCPYKCNFCYNNIFNKRTWRLMPLEKYKKELNILHDELKFKYIFMNDDNIGSNVRRLKEVSIFLNSLGLKWGSCIRANDISEESMAIMEKNGCDRFLLGVETGSDRILKDVIGKDLPHGLEDVRKAVKVIAKTSIKPTYSFMCNIPTETWQELKQSMAFADWISKQDPKAMIGFYVYAPYPGTTLFAEATRKGFKAPKGMAEWEDMSLSNRENLDAESLYYISGLNFRGDVSRLKFPGLRRLQILPFEISGKLRWRSRFIKHYEIEKMLLKWLYKKTLERMRKN